MSLNKESTNIAYNLGRIFAILEKIQMDSSNGATNIRKNIYLQHLLHQNPFSQIY